MKGEIRSYIERVLALIGEESAGRRNAPRVALAGDAREAADGSLSGALEVRVTTRTGENRLAQRNEFTGLRTHEDVDDLFARTLSTFLMKGVG